MLNPPEVDREEVWKERRVNKYKFNKLRIFDTRGLSFLKPTGESQDKHYVLDEFNIKVKNKKFYHVIPTEDDFPRNIYISTDEKKLMAHSLLTPAEMSNPEYSSFFIQKQVERNLESNGIKAKLEWIKRHYEDKDKDTYEEKDWLLIDQRDEEEVWKERRVNTYHTWLGSFRSRMVQRMMDSLGQMP